MSLICNISLGMKSCEEQLASAILGKIIKKVIYFLLTYVICHLGLIPFRNGLGLLYGVYSRTDLDQDHSAQQDGASAFSYPWELLYAHWRNLAGTDRLHVYCM